MVWTVVVASMAVLALGYFTYGRLLARHLSLDDRQVTPAHTINDGVDFVPAKASLLLGQHFSAIAAAGPIVGPVLAGVAFGWVPTLLWIVVGAILIGGVHDFVTLLASVRHQGASVGQIAKQYFPSGTHVFFLVFIWLALLYVIVAFTDITAQTFRTVTAGTAFGPAVAASSILYLGLALVMGVLLYRFKTSLWATTAIFLPLVLLAVWLGPKLPPSLLGALGGVSVKQWDVVLLVYCFVASVIPVWMLLQSRGYLGGWLLYMTIGIGLLGALFGGFKIEYTAVNLSGLHSLAAGSKLVFPFLFITVACGACSGFHAIVCSGTTSKQINKESDTRLIGYGGMLLEALVAVLALATVMMLAPGSPALKDDPNLIYAKGLAGYLGLLGVGVQVALPFALLAFSTFVYDTLDVATRLARYVLQEITGWKGPWGVFAATFISLAIPLVFLMGTQEKAYLVAWPIFGTSNQMLASLTLLAMSVWLARTGRRAIYALVPMVFMFVTTIVALVLQIWPFLKALSQGMAVTADMATSGICGVVLLALAILSVISAARTLAGGGMEPARQESEA